jgi:raffinose/stachyose/melibiose transport system permease protein
MQKTIRKYFPIFVLPTFIAFGFAFLIPFVSGLYLSFCKFTTMLNPEWVGIKNYINIFSNRDFINAFYFTVKFAVASIISINFFAFVLALVLTRKVKGTNLFRTVFFMPNLIGGIILGYIWQSMINAVLAQYETTLVANATYGYWGLVILMNWQLTGYLMIIYIAGLQNISGDLIEAARIDGASPWQLLTNIKIPMVMPSITICLFVSVSNCFKLFDQNLALTAGAPSKKTAMMSLDIYNTIYGSTGTEGVGQAKAVIFFILVGAIALVQLMITKKREVEQ